MPGEAGAVGLLAGFGVPEGSGVSEVFGAAFGVLETLGVFEGVGEAERVGAAEAFDAPDAGGMFSVPAGRDERKANVCPSGDQRGEVEDCALVVNCRGGWLPSVAATQMFERRRFCF